MPKLTLSDVTNLGGNPVSAQQIINTNSDRIEAAIEKTLSRDGTSPNQMEADFDMNHYDILNARIISGDMLIIDGVEFDGAANWIVSSGAPGSAVGSLGDIYMNSLTGDVYGPKTSDGWGTISANIKGPQGNQGPQGVQGLQGIQGIQGMQGPQGLQGPAGPQGNQGPQGDSFSPDAVGVTSDRATYDDEPAGFSFLDSQTGFLYFKLSGASGDWSAGVTFTTGPQGPVGPQGIQGPEGPQGVEGPQGIQGPAGAGVPTGGTAGQVLTKASLTDYDATWQDIPNIELIPYLDTYLVSGETEYSAACLRALNDTGVIRLAAKDYPMSASVVFNNKRASIIGAGAGVSRFIVSGMTADQNLFSFEETMGNGDTARWLIRDVGFMSNQVAMGCALRFKTPDSFADRWIATLRVEGCNFGGATDYSTGFKRGIYTDQLNNVVIHNCSFKGVGGGTENTEASTTISDTAIDFNGDYSPTEVIASNCTFYFWKKGINGGGSLEGMKAINCTFVFVLQAIYWHTGLWNPNYPNGQGGQSAAGRPQLVVIGCHANVFRSAIDTDGVVSVHISDNLFYMADNTTATGNVIQIFNSQWGNIHGNEIWSFSSAFPANGIVFGPASGGILGASFYRVRDNIFRGDPSVARFSTHIWTMAQTSNIDHRRNLHYGLVTTAHVFDQTTGGLNVKDFKGFIRSRSSDLSIPNNTGTSVVFSTNDLNNIEASTSSSTRLTVTELLTGGGYVKVSAGVTFASNSTGIRSIEIRMNGSQSFKGYAASTSPASPAGVQAMTVVSGPIPVAVGDYFEIVVYQNSGGALNIVAPNIWASLESYD